MKGGIIFLLTKIPFDCMKHFGFVLPQDKNAGGCEIFPWYRKEEVEEEEE